MNHARVQVTRPPRSCGVSENRIVLVALQWVWLRKSEFKNKSYETEYEQGWKKNWAHKNSEQEAFLFGDHLDIGLSPLLCHSLALDKARFCLLFDAWVGKKLRDLLLFVLGILGWLFLEVKDLHVQFGIWLENKVVAPLLNTYGGHLAFWTSKSLNLCLRW